MFFDPFKFDKSHYGKQEEPHDHSNTPVSSRDKHNLPCWDCGGTTSVSYYANNGDHGKLFCHKCDSYSLSKDFIEEYLNCNTYERLNSSMNTQKDNTQHFKSASEKTPDEFLRGIFSGMPERKISKEVCEVYGVEQLFHDDEPYGYMFPFHDEDGVFKAQKIKVTTNKRQQKVLGPIGKTTLFGAHLFNAGQGKIITITEGEEDAMAVHQILKQNSKWQNHMPVVVSVKNGAGSAVKELKKNWQFVNSFDTIIICFDGDPIGKQAAKEAANLFPHKTKVVNFFEAKKEEVKDETGTVIDTEWVNKDACDYLKNGRDKDFMQLWFSAEKHTPQGVRTFRSLWEDMTRKDLNTCVPFPFEGLNELCRGMITGRLDVWKAFPKVGKTTILSKLIMHIRETTEYNTGVIFLESTAKEIGMRLCGFKMGEELLSKDDKDLDWKALREAHEFLSEDDRIVLFDPEDERTAENIFEKILYFVKAHDCKFIFLDHATMLSYSSTDDNERTFLDKLYNDLKELTAKLDIYIGVVTHVNDDGKTRGSRAPGQLCDRQISLFRDKMNPDPIVSNTTEIMVEENRFGGSGLACKVFYDKDTGDFTELEDTEVSEQYAEQHNTTHSFNKEQQLKRPEEIKFDE